MKRLYLVRHGQSEGNVQKIYQDADSPLSRAGREQAATLQKRFESITVDAFYSSPLRRAMETAEIINEVLRLPIQPLDALKEWGKPGSLIGTPSGTNAEREFFEALRLHPDDPYWKWQDEESVGEMRNRIVKVLKEMKEAAEENILFVTHSRPLKLALGIVLGFPGTLGFFPARIHNTGITIFEMRDGDADWRLLTWNDMAHLGELEKV